MKIKILCGILALVMSSACIVFIANDNLNGQTNIPVPPDSDLASTVMDKPSDGAPSAYTPQENLYIAAGELQRSGGFRTASYGTSTSMGITQEVASERTVSGGNVFKQSVSTGMIKMGSQFYLWDDNHILRDAESVKGIDNVSWKDTAQKLSKDAFLNKYGYRSDGLTGYILNDKTIIGAELEKEENGVYTFRYALDTAVAPYYVLYEMRNNAGTKGFGSFIRAEVIVEMDSDWRVISFATDCEYKVPILGGVNCKESLKETFFDIGYDGDLPEKDFFEKFFDAQINDDTEKEPDALSVLMEIFQPYLTGEKLNASLSVASEGNPLVEGLVSANIDIENLDNITADIKVGDDLYLSYGAGKIFVTYGDFKGSTTVDGITGIAGSLIPSGGGLSSDADALLKELSYKIENGVCTVSLPISLGELNAEVNLYADVSEQSYVFTGAQASIGGITVDIKPAAAWDMPERKGEYPEILGIADLFKEGVLSLNAEIGGINADIMFDMSSKSLYLRSGDLSAAMLDGIVYVTYGEVKVKVALSDIGGLLELLAPLTEGLMPEMPTVSVEGILALLGSLKAVSNGGNSVDFILQTENVSVSLALSNQNGRWKADCITAALGETEAVITPAEAFEPPVIDKDQYADVTEMVKTYAAPVISLIKGESYGADFTLFLDADGKEYRAEGSVQYDSKGNLHLSAVVFDGSAGIIDADIVYAERTVFLTVNGLRAAFSLKDSGNVDLTAVLGQIYGNSDVLDGLIDEVRGLADKIGEIDLQNVDFKSIISSFGFENGVLGAVLNGSQFGLGSFGLNISANGESVVLGVSGLKFASFGLDAEVTAYAAVADIVVPAAADYMLKLKGEAFGAEAYIAADLTQMKVTAEIRYKGEKILAQFADGSIYGAWGNVAVKLGIADIDGIINSFAPFISASGFAAVDFDFAALLECLKFDLTADSPNISLVTDGFGVYVNFINNNGSLVFDDITLEFAGQTVCVTQTAYIPEELNTNGIFVDAAPVIGKIADIAASFADNDGLSADLTAQLTIDGTKYNAEISLSYNGGLKVCLAVSDSTKLIDAEIYYGGGKLLLDINGIRAALNVSSLSAGNAAFDLKGVTASLYGYNDVLDGILDFVSSLTEQAADIKLSELISSFDFDGSVLHIGIAGSLLGLNDFEISFGFDGGVSAAVTAVTIGELTLDKLTATAEAGSEEVTLPDANGYAAELKLMAGGTDVFVKLDLYNKEIRGFADILGGEAALLFKEGRIYLTYGGAGIYLDVSDIGKIISAVSAFGGESGSSDLNVKEILNSVRKINTEKGYSLGLSVSTVRIELYFDCSSGRTVLSTAEVKVGDVKVSAVPVNGAVYPETDVSLCRADAAQLVSDFAEEIAALVGAKGFNIPVAGRFAFGGSVYDVQANVTFNGGVYVDLKLAYGGVNVLEGQVYVVDGILYLSANGLKLAVSLPAGGNESANLSFGQTLRQFKGYNLHADMLIDLVADIYDKFDSNLADVSALLSSLSYRDGILTLGVDGSQFGLSEFTVALSASDGLSMDVKDLSFGSISADIAAEVSVCETEVTAPGGDWTTDLAIEIDAKNTVYANLDLLNGVYRLRLADLNVMYADNTVRINYNDEMLLKVNISELQDIIGKIIKLAEEFGGTSSGQSAALTDLFGDIDLKAIANSIVFTADKAGDSAKLSLQAMGFDITVGFFGGKHPTFSGISIPVAALGKTFVVTPDIRREYSAFDAPDSQYVSLEAIFNDYFPTLEKLVSTDGWHFDLNAEVTVGQDKYLLAEGSYLDFVYRGATGIQLRAKLNIDKQTDGAWKDFMTLDAAYIDGRIYVDYNGMKLTLSMEAINRCAGLFDDLLKAVPQLQTLIDNLKAAQSEAENNTKLIDYSTVLREASYNDGAFRLVINGNVFLEKLGDIDLTFSRNNGTLSLKVANFSYDNVAAEVVNVAVSPRAYDECLNDITAYDSTAYHINMDSLYEFLSAFITTADDKSFLVEGTVDVDLTIIGNISVAAIGLYVRVDIDDNGKVFVAVKLVRSSSIAFADKGGNSYLYYNGETDSLRVVRDSYNTHYWCTKYNVWNCSAGYHLINHNTTFCHDAYTKLDSEITGAPGYDSGELTPQQFSAGIMDYILKMVNFGKPLGIDIEGKIKGSATSESSSEFGIEEVIKDCVYSADSKTFTLKADLKPIDGNLGAVTLNVVHDDKYNLKSLNGQIKLVSVITVGLDLNLLTPTAGQAKESVTGWPLW